MDFVDFWNVDDTGKMTISAFGGYVRFIPKGAC